MIRSKTTKTAVSTTDYRETRAERTNIRQTCRHDIGKVDVVGIIFAMCMVYDESKYSVSDGQTLTRSQIT